MTSPIAFDDFMRVDIRVGKIVAARFNPTAIKPALHLEVDFGGEIGIKHSSAQLTIHYTEESLIGRQVIAVVNFPPKRIAGVKSEVLVLGVRIRTVRSFCCIPITKCRSADDSSRVATPQASPAFRHVA